MTVYGFISLMKGVLTLLTEAVLKDDLVHDFSADHAPPAEKIFAGTIKLLVNHDPAATMALHLFLLFLHN
jgi:hypothetical protein